MPFVVGLFLLGSMDTSANISCDESYQQLAVHIH
jgi:hypothetical protein